MAKKILAAVLSLAVLVTMTPMIAFAETSSGKTIKNASKVEYYTEDKTINGKSKTVKTGVKSFDYKFTDVNKTRRYSDVSENQKTKLDAKSIQKILTTDFDGKGTILQKWANLGTAVLSYGGGTGENKYTYVGQNSYSEDYKPGVSESKNKVDVKKRLGQNSTYSSGSLGDSCARSTGLVSATCLNDVREAAGQWFADVVDKKGTTKSKALDRKDLDEALPQLKDTNKTQAYYNIVASMYEPSCDKRKVNIYGICFYDFKVRQIADDNIDFTDAAAGYDSIQQAAADSSTGVDYTATEDPTSFTQVNKSAMEAGYEATTTTNHTETFHSTVTEGYEYEEEDSLGEQLMIHLGEDESPVSSEFTFNYGHRWQETWSSSKEEEIESGKESERTQTTHIDMPPHTSLTINHNTTEVSYSLPYNAPVEVTYKVVVFSMSGDVFSNNSGTFYNNTSGYETADTTVFFGSEDEDGVCCAADSVGNRWDYRDVNGYDKGLGTCYRYYHKGTGTTSKSTDGVKWQDMATKSDNGDVTDVIKNIDLSRPLLAQGADIVKSGVENTSNIEELQSLYPIEKVGINDPKNTTGGTTYNVLNGGTMLLPSGVFKAVDVEGAEYYDFMEALGHWTIKSGADVVELDHDYDEEEVKAANVIAKKAGSAVLRWEFDDPNYILESVNGNVRAGDVKSMPEIGINVYNSSTVSTSSKENAEAVEAEEAVETAANVSEVSDIQIKATGNTAVAGEPVSLDDLVQLTGTIDNKRVNVYTDLKASEKPTRPADVDPDDYDDSDWSASADEDGKVTFTGPGTYTVKAKVGNEVLLAAVKVGEEREIVGAAFAKKSIKLTGKPSINLSSFLKVKDQYGQTWTVDEWREMRGTADLKLMFKVKGPKKTVTITRQSFIENLSKILKTSGTNAFVTNNFTPGKYTITIYKDNKKMASMKVTVKKMPSTKVKSLKARKSAVKVKLKKNKSTVNGYHVTGYQIRYSTKKNMDGAKIINVKGYKKTSKTIKNLKGGKKYYVSARTYIKKKFVSVHSKWSKVKAVKVKK